MLPWLCMANEFCPRAETPARDIIKQAIRKAERQNRIAEEEQSYMERPRPQLLAVPFIE